MSRSGSRVVQVGPSRRALGGISRVLEAYSQSGLAERFDLRFVSSIECGSPFRRYVAFVPAVFHTLLLCADPRTSLLHLHVASRGSFLRKRVLFRIAKMAGCRVLVHLHGGGFTEFFDGANSSTKRSITRFFQNADAVFVVSKAMARFLSQQFGVNADVMPNPVRIPELRFRERSSPMVLTMGHLGPMKGTDVLIQSATEVCERLPQTTFVLAGDGDIAGMKATAQMAGVSEHVEFTGWVAQDAIDKLLVAAEVFALPSLAEGTPLSLLEAMAWGLPCVATPIGGIPDIIEDGRTGLLVPPCDPESLARALMLLLSDRELADKIGEAGRDYVVANNSLDSVTARVSAAYTRLGVIPLGEVGVGL